MVSPTILLALSIFIAVFLIHQRRRRAKLLPGPPGLPFIGNLHQAPKSAPWLTFKKWVKQYGTLVSVDLGGTTLIIVGDYETAKNLLDKRPSIYSSRPRMIMGQELVCHTNQILLKPFGEESMLHQRLEAPVLIPRAAACYTPIQDLESKQLIFNMLNSPNDFVQQIERFAGSVAYFMAFGMRIITGNEWQLLKSRECVSNFNIAGQPGIWIVDALPWLNYLPVTLAPWKKTAAKWFGMWTDLHQTNGKKLQYTQGVSLKVYYRDALERDGWNWSKDFQTAKEAQSRTEEQVAWDVGILCDAGVETTSTTLQVSVLACVAQPHWILTAQKELDDIVGIDRLPDFEDLKNLPYIQAVVEENFRWHHPVPAGVPHATTQADEYKGYHIPKGSIIIPLFDAMRQDKRLFDAPNEFRPERWLGKSQSGNFGYGRRICVGRHIARNSLTIAIARMLWAFDIRPRDGQTVRVDGVEFATGFVSAPMRVGAVFVPRSETHARVVREAFEATEEDVARLLNSVREKQVSIGLKC